MLHKIEHQESVGLKRALCSCGWMSNTYTSRFGPSSEAQNHLEEEIDKLEAARYERESIQADLKNPSSSMFGQGHSIWFGNEAVKGNEKTPIEIPKNGEALADQVRAELMSFVQRRNHLQCAECGHGFTGVDKEGTARMWADHMMQEHPSLIAAIVSYLTSVKTAHNNDKSPTWEELKRSKFSS